MKTSKPTSTIKQTLQLFWRFTREHTLLFWYATIEQGSHKELLRADGTYARLWAHQSGGFIEDDEE